MPSAILGMFVVVQRKSNDVSLHAAVKLQCSWRLSRRSLSVKSRYKDTSSGVAPSRDQPQGVCKVQDLRVDVAWSLIMATVVQGWCKDGFGRMEHRIRDDLPIAFCHAAWRLCGSRAALGL